MRHYELLIGGHFFGGPCDQSISKTVSRSPFNGQTIGAAAEASLVEAQAALDAAVSAFSEWKDSTRQHRHEVLSAISAKIREESELLVELAVDEIGKPVSMARIEVERTASTFELAAEEAQRMSPVEIDVTHDKRAMGHHVIATRFPIGPILCVTPYNWPYNLAAHKVAPALAAGNTVVLKGSERAALCTLALGRLIHEAGCPYGVVNVLNATGETISKIAASDQFAMISFTGSPQVGWMLKKAHPFKRVTLELGGNAFAIVCDDASIDSATAKLVNSAYGYAGQICISTQHILVHDSVFEEARSLLIERTHSFGNGDPSDLSVLCGPLIDLDSAKRVESVIHEAVAAGGVLLAGGHRNGILITPTLMENIPPSCSLYAEEVFGPVVTLDRFSTIDEAIERVNKSAYGIHTAVFTQRPETVHECYRRLEVGGLIVNEPPSLRFDNMPYGGLKKSGFGREGVPYAIDEMSEWKTLVRL